MAITVDISSGRIDVGETKTLKVTPLDENGDALVPTTLTAVFTPPTGDATTKNKPDFALASGVYSVNFTFGVAGPWKVVVTAVDGLSNTEIESGTIRVHTV
jgi:nitrogen fixation protein FixH